LSACYLAALTLLLAGAAEELLRSALVPDAWVWAQAAASLLAFGLAWKRWPLAATVFAAAAVAFDAIGRHSTQINVWDQALAVLLLIPLIGRRRPMPSRWLAVLLLPLVGLIHLPLFLTAQGYGWVLLLLVLACALSLTVLDHRIGLAVALIGLLSVADAGLTMKYFFRGFSDLVHAMWLPALLPLLVLVLGDVLTRRRARI
jgi:hypothetical protein